MTLYTYDKDPDGKVTCTATCAQNWPPMLVESDAPANSFDGARRGNLTIVVGEDGKRQWAYKDKPLYHYAKDLKAGDAAGDKVGDVWHVVGLRGFLE